MSERQQVKSRQCKVCNFYFPTTAEQIKEHAKKCDPKNPKVGYTTIDWVILEKVHSVISE